MTSDNTQETIIHTPTPPVSKVAYEHQVREHVGTLCDVILCLTLLFSCDSLKFKY